VARARSGAPPVGRGRCWPPRRGRRSPWPPECRAGGGVWSRRVTGPVGDGAGAGGAGGASGAGGAATRDTGVVVGRVTRLHADILPRSGRGIDIDSWTQGAGLTALRSKPVSSLMASTCLPKSSRDSVKQGRMEPRLPVQGRPIQDCNLTSNMPPLSFPEGSGARSIVLDAQLRVAPDA
jgi:hypothetical protein